MKILNKMQAHKRHFVTIGGVITLMFACVLIYKDYQLRKSLRLKQEELESLQSSFNTKFWEDYWPSEIKVGDNSYDIQYTLNDKLTTYIKRLLKRYRSDYSSVIVLDNNTGEVLSAIGYERQGNKFNSSMPFSSSHPSASLFKIVTAAQLLENDKIENDTVFHFRGRGTTLYKYQLNNKKNRWSRRVTFKKAFAYSNNVVFGKAAINNLSSDGLFDKALDFGFNKQIMSDLMIGKSSISIASDEYNRAEIASGFNRKTLISPLHGAVMASIVANDGVLKYPKVIESINNTSKKEKVWAPEVKSEQVLDYQANQELQELMELTVKRGTARGVHRRLPYVLRTNLTVGGKTGSITGGVPFGKRDWFSVYAMPTDDQRDKGISICVMNVNVKKWYVKSTFLAKSIIQYYYKKVSPLRTQFTKANDKKSKSLWKSKI